MDVLHKIGSEGTVSVLLYREKDAFSLHAKSVI